MTPVVNEPRPRRWWRITIDVSDLTTRERDWKDHVLGTLANVQLLIGLLVAGLYPLVHHFHPHP